MAAPKGIDWESLKTEYATSDISYRKMCDEHHVCISTLTKKAAEMDWTGARKKYREKVVSKTVNKIAGKRADKLATMMRSADKVGEVIEQILQDNKQFFRSIDQFGNEYVNKKADIKALHEMTGAMKNLTQVIRNVYNIPTDQENLSMKIARERLEIEKRKVPDEEAADDNTGVVIMPAILPDISDTAEEGDLDG